MFPEIKLPWKFNLYILCILKSDILTIPFKLVSSPIPNYLFFKQTTSKNEHHNTPNPPSWVELCCLVAAQGVGGMPWLVTVGRTFWRWGGKRCKKIGCANYTGWMEIDCGILVGYFYCEVGITFVMHAFGSECLRSTFNLEAIGVFITGVSICVKDVNDFAVGQYGIWYGTIRFLYLFF